MRSEKTKPILALGQLRSEERAVLEAAARRVGTRLETTSSAHAAFDMMKVDEPALVVVETSAVGADKLCQAIRQHERWRGVPIIGMPRDLNDRIFAKAFRWGVDDLVRLGDWQALEKRLHCLREAGLNPQAASAGLGRAVVADADPARCTVMGRVLGGAGYAVQYAPDLRTLEYYARDAAVRLVVTGSNLGDVYGALLSARQRNAEATWVIAAPAKAVTDLASKIAHLDRVGVTNAAGPPENVVFFANELMNRNTRERRGTARNLCGTTVAFRVAGETGDEHGFTYNVSPRGMYIRTFLSVPHGEVWLEARPPRGQQLVRLLGRVIWGRPVGATLGLGTPPGFAVQISDGLAKDLELWEQGCEELEATSQRKPSSLRPRVIGLGPLEAAQDDTFPPGGTGRPNLANLVGAADTRRGASEESPESAPEEGNPDDPVLEIGPASEPPSGAPSSVATGRLGRMRVGRAGAMAAALVLVLVAGGLVVWTLEKTTAVSRPTARPQVFRARPAATFVTAGRPATPSAQPLSPASSAPPPVGSAATATASAEPLISPPAGASSAAAEPSATTEPDLAQLEFNQGFLKVVAPATARVIVQGKDAGETNAWMKVRCGARFVRLAREGGGFLEPGKMVVIPCRGATHVQLAPKG